MSNYPRRFNKKRSYRKQNGKGLNKVQKLQIEKMITSKPEKKYYDFAFVSTNISSTPQFWDILAPAQGLLSNSVIGSEISLQSIQFNLMFNIADVSNWIRMVIFQWWDDTSPTGAVTTNAFPTWNRMFQFGSGVGGTPINQYERMSPYLTGDGRAPVFKVLKDVQFCVDVDTPLQLQQGFINKGYRKNIGMNFDANPIPPGINHIIVMMVSDSGAIPNPVVDGNFRCRYTDS